MLFLEKWHFTRRQHLLWIPVPIALQLNRPLLKSVKGEVKWETYL